MTIEDARKCLTDYQEAPIPHMSGRDQTATLSSPDGYEFSLDLHSYDGAEFSFCTVEGYQKGIALLRRVGDARHDDAWFDSQDFRDLTDIEREDHRTAGVV